MAAPTATIAIRAILSLATGATLTFALAGPAAVIEDRNRPFGGARGADLEFAPATCVTARSVSRARGHFGERWSVMYLSSCCPSQPDYEHVIPEWVSVQKNQPVLGALAPIPNGAVLRSETTAAGWPYRAFVCTFDMKKAADSPTLATSLDGGWTIDNPLDRMPSVIPYTPIWPGLLANWAIFTAAASPLLFIGPARRALRRRRNHCPHCNYAHTGLAQQAPCPECGRPTC